MSVNGSSPTLTFGVPDELVDAIARRVVELMPAAPQQTDDPWLDVEAAAAYIAAKPGRIYELKAAGRIRPAYDGKRLLFRRSWLDAYLEGSE
jgi:hypothetical protein